jgi:hypothetical protein
VASIVQADAPAPLAAVRADVAVLRAAIAIAIASAKARKLRMIPQGRPLSILVFLSNGLVAAKAEPQGRSARRGATPGAC